MRSLLQVILFSGALATLCLAKADAADAPRAAMPDRHRALFKDHCVACHGPEKQKGKFRVDELPLEINTIEHAEKWQKVLNALNSGEMPPEDQKQPNAAAKTDFLDDLSNVMVAARRNLSDQNGTLTMRRLNRREYKNTLRALLGVDINVSELPADTGTGGFDTFGSNLFMSANQFEQYQNLGREALEEAFARLAVAGEQRKLRYEAEDTLKTITKTYNEKIDALARAKRWAAAVEAAAARPENAAVVAEIRKESKDDATFRRSWQRIAGAPAPEDFGFTTVENNADKANGALGYEGTVGAAYMRPYHERYLKQPHLDTGAYLTIMAGTDIGNDTLSIVVPHHWPVGEYTVRVRLAAAPEAPPERRFIEFGIHPRNGQVMSTHEVTGTMDAPQTIEIPLTLTKGNAERDNRTLFIREKGSNDHFTQTRRIFGEGKAKNGIGPDLALWVDWMEVERKPDTTPAEPKFTVGANRQLGFISAKGLNKVRYECETANEKVSAYVAEQIDARTRAQNWVKAVDAAAARPENAAAVAEIRKSAKNDATFRRSWDKIQGAPSPESFGFKTEENNADKANSALGENWQKYHEYYLARPALDRGAYLGTPTMHPAVMALGFLQLPVPSEWNSGDYVLRVRVAASSEARPEQRFLEAGMHPRNGMVRATFEITGTMESPQTVEMPFTLSRVQDDPGDRTLFIREKGAWDNNDEGGRKRSEAVKRNGTGPEAVLWIDYMEIERLTNTTQPDRAPAIAALRLPLDDQSPAPSSPEIYDALQRFATVAFRGAEPPRDYLENLTSIYETRRKAGAKHTASLRETLSVVLSSPMFLYLAEPAPDNKRRPLTGPELATRLSFFLWGAPPDEQLLELAHHGRLENPGVLASETTRLLDDPRSRDFVQGLIYQWLGMDRLDFFEVNRPKYPRFDDSTRLAAKKEVYETFAHLLQHNAPLHDLLKADYAVLNHLLAEFYGIPGVSGDGFRKVQLPPDSPRGGLLGMAAVALMGSNGDRTSPVERGAWVLRKLLHEPPPPAPANIPQIARLAGKVLTTRERLQMHQEDAQCASCHRKIDPVGFALENLDAVGQWRTEDSYQVMDEKGKPVKGAAKTWQIEASGQLYKGAAFRDYFEFRNIVASKADAFAKGFSEVLLEYALGRPAGFRDEPLVAQMVDDASRNKLAVRSFIHTLVGSKEFHTK
jgi:mono/diheme cytochrome c family protein